MANSEGYGSFDEQDLPPSIWNQVPRVESPDIQPMVDDGDHPLLRDESPAYSPSVIQRSFITWVHLGKTNPFKDICDYFHRLEKLEATYPLVQRAKSRLREYSLIDAAPPMSEYFLKNWGHIYGVSSSNTPKPSRQTDNRLDGIWGDTGAEDLVGNKNDPLRDGWHKFTSRHLQ